MTMDQLKLTLHAQPFQPFALHLADGRELQVRHPDFIALSPAGRTCTVYATDEAAEHVDILLVTSLRILNGEHR